MSVIAIKLPRALEKFLAAQVEEGAYRNAEEAIIGAVQKEKRRAERHAWLRAEIQRGIDSRSTADLDMQDVIRRGRARSAARKLRAPKRLSVG